MTLFLGSKSSLKNMESPYSVPEDNEKLAQKQYPKVWFCLDRMHPVAPTSLRFGMRLNNEYSKAHAKGQLLSPSLTLRNLYLKFAALVHSNTLPTIFGMSAFAHILNECAMVHVVAQSKVLE